MVLVYVMNVYQGEATKSFRYRPDVDQRVPGGLGSQIFMTFSI
jgi:hypothetical protein